MGIVAKQSIWNTLLTYLGFVFGALNTLFLFTHILDSENYGLVSYILASSNLLWPLIAFGLQNTLMKFYHTYENFNMQSRFFTTILAIPIVMLVIVVGIYFFNYEAIMLYFEASNPIVKSFVWLIILIGFCSAYFEIFYSWTKVHLQSIKGNLLKELFHRVIISILLVCVYFKVIDTTQFMYGLGILYILRTLIMKLIALKIKKPSFNVGKLPNFNELLVYSALILIASTVSVFLLDIDKVMIERYLPVENVAIYSICVYMASVVEVPTRAILQISNPLTAKFLVEKDYAALNDLNKQTSINGYVITSFIALLIVCNVTSLYELMPEPYVLYIDIVVYISVVKLFDAALGITNSIVFNSNHYKWILIFGVAILCITYYLNTLFIPTKGISGAAFATFLAYSLYNIAKLIFVYITFKLQPFSLATLKTTFFVLLLGVSFYFWNFTQFHPVVAISLKSSLMIVSFSMVLKFFRLSPEVNKQLNKLLNKVRSI